MTPAEFRFDGELGLNVSCDVRAIDGAVVVMGVSGVLNIHNAYGSYR